MAPLDKWLTLEELASYLKLSHTKLDGMAQKGLIPCGKVGNQWRFDRKGVDRWVKAQGTSKVAE